MSNSMNTTNNLSTTKRRKLVKVTAAVGKVPSIRDLPRVSNVDDDGGKIKAEDSVKEEVSFLTDSPAVKEAVSSMIDSPEVKKKVSAMTDSPAAGEAVSALTDFPAVKQSVSTSTHFPGIKLTECMALVRKLRPEDYQLPSPPPLPPPSAAAKCSGLPDIYVASQEC